jgi:hypothetical protein
MIKLERRLHKGKMAYPGVHFNKKYGKWAAKVKKPMGYQHIAWCDTEQEAVDAVEAELNKNHE